MPVCSSVALQRTPLGRRKARHTATLNFITRMDLLLVPPDAIFESRLYLDVDPRGIRATIDLVT
jgi:hypothetical protein